MCVIVQKKYVALMLLLKGYRTAELHINMLKDNIEMDKEMALMTS
jgi:hypothetical protein